MILLIAASTTSLRFHYKKREERVNGLTIILRLRLLKGLKQPENIAVR
jgi:hypothetical protein